MNPRLILFPASFALILTGSLFAQSDTILQQQDTTPLVDPTTPPGFPGGDQALSLHMSKHMQWHEGFVEGTVWVEFTVGADGVLTDVHVKQGIPDAPQMDEEALRMVRSLPPFTPAYLNGVPQAAEMLLPVRFKAEFGLPGR